VRGHGGQDAIADHSAFIQRHLQLDSPLREQAGDLSGSLRATRLLVVPVREVHRARRPEAGAQQRLDGLECADDGGLVVDGAATSDEPVADPAAKRRLLPALLGPWLDRNDVLMAEPAEPLDEIGPREREHHVPAAVENGTDLQEHEEQVGNAEGDGGRGAQRTPANS
jgi:hypothetical protein